MAKPGPVTMSTARLPRKLKILGGTAVGICVSASLVASANPAAPQAAITRLGGSLAAVSASSATDAWAVGKERPRGALALHWNGTSWAQVLTPAPARSSLSGVTDISPTDAWAVGFSSTRSGSRTLVLHWNGTAWTAVSSPSPGISALSGVSAVSADDVWAVGIADTTGRSSKTLVLHWDGSKWAQVPSPTPPGQVIVLNAVSAVSPTDVWAVGRDLTKTLGKTLMLHWDGSKWTQMPSPSPGMNDNGLSGVDMTSATDGWAVGYAVNSLGEGLTLVLHWDGSKWTQVPSPSFGLPNGGGQLQAVSALTGSDAWASGWFLTKGGGTGTLLLHWNGTSWTRVPAPSPRLGGPTGGSFLTGVDMVATADVWSTGATFSGTTGLKRTLLLHWNGTTWTRS